MVTVLDILNKYTFIGGTFRYRYDIISGNGRIIKRAGDVAGCYKGRRAERDGGTIQINNCGFQAARAAYMVYKNTEIDPNFFINFIDKNPLNLAENNLEIVNGHSHNDSEKKSKLPRGVFLIKPKKWQKPDAIRFCAKMKIKRGVDKYIQGPYRKTQNEAKQDYILMIERYALQPPAGSP